MTEIRISAKDLGALSMPDFCPRCFWIKRKVKQLPFQIFPGIFSSIDAYTKRIVHKWFDIHQGCPDWLPELRQATAYLPNMHWSKFKRLDSVTGLTVSGVTDDVFFCGKDGKHIIVDYKTAKFTENQDKLLPIYRTQLNGYAWICEGLKQPVKSLYLIYCEPVTDAEKITPYNYHENGFDMGFSVKSIEIDLEPGMTPGLLSRAKKIMDLEDPPSCSPDCKDCEKLNNLISTINGD
jgi:hypothetical protein